MREESFELKSNKYVLTLVLRSDVPFAKLVRDVGDKFKRSANFFKGGQMAVRFKGMELSELQEAELVDAITENCQLDITCIIEDEPETEERQREAIVRAMSSVRQRNSEKEPSCVLLSRSLKNGERYSSSKSVLLLGDLEPGAEICSEGSIYIYGIAMGNIRAGIGGDETSIATALVMKPALISIGSRKAVSAIRKRELSMDYPEKAVAAYVSGGRLLFEDLSPGAFARIMKKLNEEDAGRESEEAESRIPKKQAGETDNQPEGSERQVLNEDISNVPTI